jgi:DNA-binding NtrC family response regulator
MDQGNDKSLAQQEEHARGSVLLLDDDADLRAMLATTVAELCRRTPLAAGSFDEMLAIGEQALACEVAILDVNLGAGRPSGVDAFEWLIAHGFRGRVACLTGHGRTHSAVARACQVEAARVFQKPIPIAVLCSIVDGSI